MADFDINAAVQRWRTGVKKKMRGIASFEERAQLRFDALRERIYSRRIVVDNWMLRESRYLGASRYEYLDADFRPIKIGEQWGGDHITGFFKRRVEIPREMAGQKVVLRIYVGGDSLLSIDGVPYHGLDPFRHEVPLCPRAKGGEVFDIEIESYVTFNGGDKAHNPFHMAELAAVDQEIWEAYWDLYAVAKALQIVEIDPKLETFLTDRLWEAMKLIPLREEDGDIFKAAALAARQLVRKEVYDCDRFKGEGLMHLVGHSHLDVVYMWPEKEFVRKIGRTHSTMLRLMEQYPVFRFCQSQAKLYADMKQHFPALFEQVKQRIAEGRWEIVGAFWVEPDCNLISGESFVRQIIHGQRFFQQEFGRTSAICWQPDVFGLSWGMPQILRRAGIEYFLTNKMVAWNDTNPWKLNTFWWEGMDGSRVLGIVPPGHFIGTVDPDLLDTQWRNFADKTTIGETLHTYGWGDGGGGVDTEMLEQAKRYGDFPGLVKTRFSGIEEAFARIMAKARTAAIDILRDEIYLEAHRGTYTHRGRLKKLNRTCELLYREAELLASLAWVAGSEYPAAAMDAGWKDLLTNQFHDALPGTHIGEVYPELLASYERIQATGQQVRNAAMAALTKGLSAGGSAEVNALAVFNSLGHARSDCLSLPAAELAGRQVEDGGRTLAQQRVADLDGTQRVLVRVPEIPPVGYRVLRLGPAGKAPVVAQSSLQVTATTLENEYLKATFNAEGELTSLFDKEHQREVLVAGQVGNKFHLFEDTPGKYDAWDIVETYRDHEIDIAGNAQLTIDEAGPVRASLLLEKKIRGSKLRQRISLSAGARQLVFETSVEWVERQRLLKVGFPVEINTDHATCDIAYGNMPRPNHRNTPHAAARFEFCAHQWMDLSQGDYGVSLLNDCKYGHEAQGKLMRLTLLKGSISPDARADMETHHFTYALYPHAGDWRTGGTIPAAANLNWPLVVWRVSIAPKVDEGALTHSYLQWSAGNLTLEAVKPSEDGHDVVVRLVERHNASTRTQLTLDRPVKEAWSCDLMERKEARLPVHGNTIEITARPCEILTIRVRV